MSKTLTLAIRGDSFIECIDKLFQLKEKSTDFSTDAQILIQTLLDSYWAKNVSPEVYQEIENEIKDFLIKS